MNQELLSELYYRNQLGERDPNGHMSSSYVQLNPNYPCIYGANAVGLSDKESVFDGHKYSCGLTEISGQPIVYSFGSDKRQVIVIIIVLKSFLAS